MDKEEYFIRECLNKDAKIGETRITDIFSNFKNITIENFKKFDFKQTLQGSPNTSARSKEFRLTENQIDRIEKVKDLLEVKRDIRETIVKYCTRGFVKVQIDNIEKTQLEDLEINPFLTRMLKLETPKQVLEYKISEWLTRSISTSLGFWFEKFLIYGHDDSEFTKVKKFDAEKKKNDIQYITEIKSGPADVDAHQMRGYNTLFNKKESATVKPRIGWLYGKRDTGTRIGALSHAEQYLENWEERVLVGKELWEFYADEPNYHLKVLKWMEETVANMEIDSFIEVEKKLVEKLVPEFEKKYGKGKDGVKKFIEGSM